MRKITRELTDAFEEGIAKKKGNTETDGETLWLHGNPIAKKENGYLFISDGNYRSNTTKERLNGLTGVDVRQKDFEWYLNGEKWDDYEVNHKDGGGITKGYSWIKVRKL